MSGWVDCPARLAKEDDHHRSIISKDAKKSMTSGGIPHMKLGCLLSLQSTGIRAKNRAEMIKTRGEWLALLRRCDGLILITNLMGFRITIKQISTPPSI